MTELARIEVQDAIQLLVPLGIAGVYAAALRAVAKASDAGGIEGRAGEASGSLGGVAVQRATSAEGVGLVALATVAAA